MRKRLTGAALADKEPQEAKGRTERVHPMFKKFLEETGSLNEAMKLMSKWQEENGIRNPPICTNNRYELELEREYVEWKCREYGIEPPSEEEWK